MLKLFKGSGKYNGIIIFVPMYVFLRYTVVLRKVLNGSKLCLHSVQICAFILYVASLHVG